MQKPRLVLFLVLALLKLAETHHRNVCISLWAYSLECTLSAARIRPNGVLLIQILVRIQCRQTDTMSHPYNLNSVKVRAVQTRNGPSGPWAFSLTRGPICGVERWTALGGHCVRQMEPHRERSCNKLSLNPIRGWWTTAGVSLTP